MKTLCVVLLTLPVALACGGDVIVEPIPEPPEMSLGPITGAWSASCCLGLHDAGASWSFQLVEDSVGIVTGTVERKVVRGLIPPGNPPPPTHAGSVVGIHYVRQVTFHITYGGRDPPAPELFRGRQISDTEIPGGIVPHPFPRVGAVRGLYRASDQEGLPNH